MQRKNGCGIIFSSCLILLTNYKKQEVRKMKKAIVLSSGGVDSTTCISVAVKELGADNVCTASIFYGQKHVKELEAARKVAEWFHVKHYEFEYPAVFELCPPGWLQ